MSFEGGLEGPNNGKLSYKEFLSYYKQFDKKGDGYLLKHLLSFFDKPEDLMQILDNTHKLWINRLKDLNNNKEKILKGQKDKITTINTIAKRQAGNYFYDRLLHKNENIKYFGPINTGSIFAYYLNFLKTLKKKIQYNKNDVCSDIIEIIENPYKVYAKWMNDNARIDGGEVYTPYTTDEEIEAKDLAYWKDILSKDI